MNVPKQNQPSAQLDYQTQLCYIVFSLTILTSFSL